MLVFLPESVFSVRSRGLFFGRVLQKLNKKNYWRRLIAFSGSLIISININLSVSSQSLLLPQMGLRRKQVSSRNFEGRGA